MRYVGNKLALVLTVSVHLICHIIQIIGKESKFILSLYGNPVGQVSIGVFRNSFFYIRKRTVNAAVVKYKDQRNKGINRKEKDLHNKKIFTAFLIKAAHHIVDGNITFGAHIVCNWGNDA